MDCFARVARSAVAIEMDPHYCAKLRERARALRSLGMGSFNVSCTQYRRVAPEAFQNADYVTWWLGGLKMNIQVLNFLSTLNATLRPNAQAVVLHDLRTGIDKLSFDRLLPHALWVAEVAVPPRECSLCKQAIAEKRFKEDRWAQCGRARGTVHVLGLPLHSSELQHMAKNLTGKLRHEAGAELAHWEKTCEV